MQLIPNARLVWIVVPASAPPGFYEFKDIPEIRGKRILGIWSYDETVMTFTPDQVAVITNADALRCTVTLREESVERQADIPLLELQTAINGGIWKDLDPYVCAFTNSGVRINFTLATATQQAIPFVVLYESDIWRG